MKNILFETLALAVLGAVVAFSANALSPRGLKLTRNYFPSGQVISVSASNAAPAQLLRDKGLQVIETAEVSTLFRDPRIQDGLIVFIDARNTQHFQEGHIPGAYEFDHYRPEQYLPSVMPVCQTAEQIIVYCTGGDCEDSQFAAIFLRDSLALPKEKIFVYVGGIHEWEAAGLPVEMGLQNSGKIRSKTK
jgi:rhodanese-related sulfurtransferase